MNALNPMLKNGSFVVSMLCSALNFFMLHSTIVVSGSYKNTHSGLCNPEEFLAFYKYVCFYLAYMWQYVHRNVPKKQNVLFFVWFKKNFKVNADNKSISPLCIIYFHPLKICVRLSQQKEKHLTLKAN